MIERDWRALANCHGVDPNDMQPEVATPDEVDAAKAVCAGCPVRRECRELALSQPGGAYGVHGGEWFGDTPRNPEVIPCQWCGEDMDPGERGTRTYCSGNCRLRAFRAREALSA